MNIVAVVPMKLNNKRLPGKNTKSFTNGEALCSYILKTLKKIPIINEIYVYCSDESIKEYIPDDVKYLKRSTDLDSDNTKINEVLSRFSKEVTADIYVMTHATSPFISSKSIEKGLNFVINEGYDSSFSAKKIKDFIWKDNQPLNYDLDNIPRTQDLPVLYMETSGFYIYKSEVIMKYNRRIGNNPHIVEVSEIESIDIDEKEDFDIADAIYNTIMREK